MGEIKRLTKEEERWVVVTDLERNIHYSFYFDFMPNNFFTEIHKQFIDDMLTLKSLKPSTINRYHNNFRHFYKFLEQYKINPNDFSELSYEIIQMYISHLKKSGMSKSSQSICVTALKAIIDYGVRFEYPGFPSNEIFDGKESKALRTNDEYTTEYIPDSVMNQIERAIETERNNLLLKCLLSVIIDTGIRLDEALSLEEGHLIEDLSNRPLLLVQSTKNNSDRFIAVSKRVADAIKTLDKSTTEVREKMNTKKLFVYKKIKYMFYYQTQARTELRAFINRHQIRGKDNTLYYFSFHSLRHRLGTDMVNNGMTILEIKEYLGHESLRSTEHYAKVQNPKVMKEYEKVGFIGLAIKDLGETVERNLKKVSLLDIVFKKDSITKNILNKAALPDGACGLPISNEGDHCVKFNMCILCPNFVTTPDFLSVHKSHLERLTNDRYRYMQDEQIGTNEHLIKTEKALRTIIKELEMLRDGK